MQFEKQLEPIISLTPIHYNGVVRAVGEANTAEHRQPNPPKSHEKKPHRTASSSTRSKTNALPKCSLRMSGVAPPMASLPAPTARCSPESQCTMWCPRPPGASTILNCGLMRQGAVCHA